MDTNACTWVSYKCALARTQFDLAGRGGLQKPSRLAMHFQNTDTIFCPIPGSLYPWFVILRHMKHSTALEVHLVPSPPGCPVTHLLTTRHSQRCFTALLILRRYQWPNLDRDANAA